MRQKIEAFIELKAFQQFIIGLIVLNAILLGMETSQTLVQAYGLWLRLANEIILWIFVVELLLRLFVSRLRFFTQPWSLFDAFVVLVALIPNSQAFAALRALRVLRVLRLLSMVPTMRKVIEGLLRAIPGIASVAAIMLLFFYVFAVVGTHLYSATFPQWFGSLGETMYSLFQIMTLESWSMGIVRPVMEQHPGAWAFFVTYILVTTFTMLNLFIAIIVNAMHTDEEAQARADRQALRETISEEISALEQRLVAEIAKNRPG